MEAGADTAAQVSNKGMDRYQIVKTLGEGSFGKVKLAYHLATNSKVALKIINRRTLLKNDMQGRIEREISYLRLLRHPHIIKLYEVIKSKDEIIMVLEFAGKELFDYIVQKGRLTEVEARRFFQQIISAIRYCHKHKIVHRDLKPENLLLDEDLNIKIADFGLSNIMTDGNFLKTSCGSPNYAAPEVISGRLYAGPEVDVWSCGVILYVMLAGRLPFDEDSIPELFQRISAGVYRIPDFLSPEAAALLQKMLVVNPMERITVDGIIQDPWFRVDMPKYLLSEGAGEGEGEEEIDQEIVQYLSQRLGYSRSDILASLKGDGNNAGNADEIRDAYSLARDKLHAEKHSGSEDVLDKYMAKRAMTGQGSRSRSSSDAPQSPSSVGRHSGVPSTFSFDVTHLGPVGVVAGSNIAVVPQSLPQYHLAYMQSRGVAMTKRLSPVSTKKSKTRWHFGIRSRSYPLDVMAEIYRALKSLNAEWATPQGTDDIWTIHVRWKNNTSGGVEELLKMRIQLYQLEQNNYLVDFKFDGFEGESKTVDANDTFSAYPFLRVATSLIMELAVNSQH